jgi:GNAT superfamily N-acetyltransferase
VTEIVIRELVGRDEMVTAYPLIRQLNPELAEPIFFERLTRMLGEGGYRCIAAYLGDRMIGVAGFWVGTQLWCGTYIEPDNVVVDDRERGAGVGKRLMQWIEAEGERLDCEIMKLEAYAQRLRTREFYRRDGFEEPGIVMVKTLSKGIATLEAIRAKDRAL